jgi:hypothetical protein
MLISSPSETVFFLPFLPLLLLLLLSRRKVPSQQKAINNVIRPLVHKFVQCTIVGFHRQYFILPKAKEENVEREFLAERSSRRRLRALINFPRDLSALA